MGRKFTVEEVHLAQSFADHAALSLENARLYAELAARVREIEASQERLLQAGKLAAVGQLVSGVAHEINNPLAVIVGQAQLLASPAARSGTFAARRPDPRERHAGGKDRPRAADLREPAPARGDAGRSARRHRPDPGAPGGCAPRRRHRPGARDRRLPSRSYRGRLPARAGAPEPRAQCRAGARGTARGAYRRSPPRSRGTGASGRRGHRTRDRGRRPAAHLRAVLHDEAGWAGHGARAVDLLQHRAESRRAPDRRKPSRPRRDVRRRPSRARRGDGGPARRSGADGAVDRSGPRAGRRRRGGRRGDAVRSPQGARRERDRGLRRRKRLARADARGPRVRRRHPGPAHARDVGPIAL